MKKFRISQAFVSIIVKKPKFVCFKWNLAVKLNEYAEFDGEVYFFCLGPKVPVLGKFGPNCLFKIKFDT